MSWLQMPPSELATRLLERKAVSSSILTKAQAVNLAIRRTILCIKNETSPRAQGSRVSGHEEMEKEAKGQAANAGPQHDSEHRPWDTHISETAASVTGPF